MRRTGRRVRWRAAGLALAGLAAGGARADADEPAAGYPVAQAQRPLLLPAGALEGGARLVASRFDFGDDSITSMTLEPRVRAGLGVLEAEAAVALHLYRDEPEGFTSDPETLQAIELAGRYRLPHDRSLGVEVRLLAPAADSSGYQPRLAFASRAHLGPGATIESGVATGLDVYRFDTDAGSESSSFFALEGRARVEAQVGSTVAMTATGRMRHLRPVGDEDSLQLGAPYLAFDVELGMVASVGAAVDLVAALRVDASNGDYSSKTFTVGVVARRLP